MDHDMTDRDHSEHDGEPTQGENPGAQGDFGAGQGEPGEEESIADADDPTVGHDGDRVEGTDQPRVDDVDGGGEI